MTQFSEQSHLPAFASHVEAIHGLEQAKNVSPSSQADSFYIYAGSFTKHDNAVQYQKSLQAKTNHTVQIAQRTSHEQDFNVVMIGPISSPAEVRKTATALLSSPEAKSHLAKDTLVKQDTHASSPMKSLMSLSLPASINNKLMWSAALGEAWYQTNNTTLQITSEERDSAMVSQATSSLLYSIGIGYHAFSGALEQNKYLTDLLVQLNYYYGTSTVKGNVWAYGSSDCNNFIFRAPMRTSRLMLDLKPELFVYRGFNPYGIFGAGASWNKMSYTEYAIDGTDAIGEAVLQGHSNVTVAYDLGVGINRPVTKNIDLAIEYLYTSLGNISPSVNSRSHQSIVGAPSFSMQSQSVLARLNWKGNGA